MQDIKRVIEFKAWHRPTQRMYTIQSINFKSGQIFQQLPKDTSLEEWDKVNENPFAFEDCILLQFTGLVDKRGQKIFEGDIMRHDNMQVGKIPEDEGEYSEYSYIGFHNGGFANYPLSSDQSERDIESLIQYEIFYLTQLCTDGHIPLQRVASMYERPDLLELKGEYSLHPDAIRPNEKRPQQTTTPF